MMFGNEDYPEPALAVGKINGDYDPLIPPATGEEYIQRVVLEASKCEHVLVASVDKSQFKEQTVNIDIAIKEPPLVTPSIEWQQCQVADFSSVRQNLARYRSLGNFKPSISLPARRDEAGWYLLCFGSDTEPVESGTSSGGVPPLLSILLSMNQPLIHQVLEYHVEWLETRSSLSVQQGQWLYSLLACLELPLLPETCSLLRTLARDCSRLRASLKSDDPPSVAPLTLIICLVANYFRQMDLADTVPE
ncbi:gem-associated protein 2 isoform X2 [Zootermopsis nevadensis]|uniref:Gem-associated protein 2 n=2 Tax=Zootermopsis nevadensis TaxID=136037 RepID=A0A067QHX6_ZOONE|nr:gem-associated protein 2 isoform X2 [Zootermopsis nevadensis]XP_021939988.1 gem-associated protein 2 isoform X2 [Zootermopsis nevadensis]KDR08042.1 Survival of motor neuron protein-interacting protein 1 [Zootermopsis nevadensis]